MIVTYWLAGEHGSHDDQATIQAEVTLPNGPSEIGRECQEEGFILSFFFCFVFFHCHSVSVVHISQMYIIELTLLPFNVLIRRGQNLKINLWEEAIIQRKRLKNLILLQEPIRQGSLDHTGRWTKKENIISIFSQKLKKLRTKVPKWYLFNLFICHCYHQPIHFKSPAVGLLASNQTGKLGL